MIPNRERLDTLRVWQQNVNKSLEAQLDMLNTISPKDIDIIAIQEPYFDFNGFSRGSAHWSIVYPPNHRSLPSRARSLLLVNTRLNSNTWHSLEIPSGDVTGIRIRSADGHDILLYNIYNDQHHSDTIRLLERHTANTRSASQHRLHALWLGDFNRHSPIWDDPANTQLFTNANLDAAQLLISATNRAELHMLLPPGIPTLFSSARTETRPDNVFGSDYLMERVMLCTAYPELRPICTDHYPVYTEFDLGVQQTLNRDRFNYKSADWDSLRKALQIRLRELGEPSEATSPDDVQAKYEVLTRIIAEVVNANVPKKKASPFMRRWWSSELTKMRKEVNRLGRLANKYRLHLEPRFS